MTDNPNAFPYDRRDTYTGRVSGQEPGMTLRDYFAAKAMQGWLSNPNTTIKTQNVLTSEAYSVADAMLEQREKTN